MKKTKISTLFLVLICGTYLFVSLIMGVITEASSAFWMGFGFLSFDTIVAVIIWFLYGNQKSTIRDVFFNAPIYYIAAIYFIVSGIISVLQMLIGIFAFKRILVIQLIVLLVFAGYFVLSLVNKSNAENVIQKVADKNRFIRDTSERLSELAAVCNDRETKLKIEALQELVQYSTPAYGTALDEYENLFRQKLAVLEYQIMKNELEAANESMKEIDNMLKKRNYVAKTLKG